MAHKSNPYKKATHPVKQKCFEAASGVRSHPVVMPRLARSFAGSGRRSARADCKRSAERCASARSDEARLLVMQTLIWWTVASLMGCMDAWRCWHVNGLPCAGCVRCRCTARGPEESSIDLQEGACSAGDILWVFPLSGTSPGRWSSFPCVRCWKK